MLNKVTIIGRLGQDPELKYMPNGNAVCNLSIATSESWKDKNGDKQEKTEWHRLVIFGKGAEVLNQYCKKGSQLYVEGKLQTRSWEDKSGTKKYMTEIVISDFKFMSSSNASKPNTSGESQEADHQPVSDAAYTSDDIPF